MSAKFLLQSLDTCSLAVRLFLVRVITEKRSIRGGMKPISSRLVARVHSSVSAEVCPFLFCSILPECGNSSGSFVPCGKGASGALPVLITRGGWISISIVVRDLLSGSVPYFIRRGKFGSGSPLHSVSGVYFLLSGGVVCVG